MLRASAATKKKNDRIDMLQAYGRLFILQRGNSEGFFTASVPGLHLIA